MNKALQKWANSKLKTLKRWAKEYHELCVKEGIKEEPIVSIAFDGNYVGSIYTTVKTQEGKAEYLINTKTLFLKNGKWS